MRRAVSITTLLLLLAATGAMAASPTTENPPFPKTLMNARFVYVTSYDGDEFSPNILPEDREAIASVENGLQKWGRYILVYRPQDADMIIAVEKRGSEDVLAVYDPQLPGANYLWRAMGRGGLDPGEMPLFAKLQKAVEAASK